MNQVVDNTFERFSRLSVASRPYLLDSHHCYFYQPFSQEFFISKFSNETNPPEGVCFGLCLNFVKDLQLFEQFYISRWNNERFYASCLKLQQEAQSYTLGTLRFLFAKNKLKQVTSPVTVVKEDLHKKSSHIHKFLFERREEIETTRCLFLFLSTRVKAERDDGHVICIAARKNKISIFDPNCGILTFAYEYAQHKELANSDLYQFVLTHIDSLPFDVIDSFEYKIAQYEDLPVPKT